jgi:peptidyl-prolyl cis-trans isomerase D
MDVFTGNNGLFGNKNQSVMGEVNNEEISSKLFQVKLDEAVENYKSNSQQAKIDENTMGMLRDQVWNDFLREKLYGAEYEKLGIMVTDEELFEMVQGQDPHPSIKQAFTNQQTGQFDRNQVVAFLRNLDKQPADVQARWLRFEEYIHKDRFNQKYNALVSKGLYATKFAVENFNKENSSKLAGRLLFQDYMSIPDSSIKPTDDELKAYFDAHKKDFESKDDNRKAEYVVFDVLPSGTDSAAIYNTLQKEVDNFRSSTNDSAFVVLNSDEPYDDRFVNRKNYNSIIQDSVFNGSVGSVFGPYVEGATFKLTKITAKAMRADSVKARHILIKPKQGEDIAKVKAKADSLKNLIKGGADFAALAKANSEDPGSAEKGGDLGKFAEGMMVKPFNDACFNGNKGDLVVVESQFGVHLIEVLENNRNVPSVKVSTIVKKIEPSEETAQAAYGKANTFAGNNRDYASFDAAIKKAGLNKRTAEVVGINDRLLAGVPDSRAIVRWVYEAKKDEVSKVFDVQNGYVVAVVTAIQEKNKANFDESKDKVAEAVKKEKKQQQLIAKLDNALKSSNNDINAAATKLNAMVQTVTDVNLGGAFLSAFGREPYVVGAMYGMKIGKVSKPMKGERGVYVAVVDSMTPAPAIADLNQMRTMVSGQMSGRAFETFNVLKEKAKIEDNRHMFF